jgi:hypothetical protein
MLLYQAISLSKPVPETGAPVYAHFNSCHNGIVIGHIREDERGFTTIICSEE